MKAVKIVALDLGTLTGYAYRNFGAILSGTWILATPREVKAQHLARWDRRRDVRVDRLRQHISELDFVWGVFEDVQFASTTYQAHLWASLRATVWLSHLPEVECCPVGTLKKFATGNGAAKKEAMAKALAQRLPADFQLTKNKVCDVRTGAVLDDNAVDAVYLLLWAEQALQNKEFHE